MNIACAFHLFGFIFVDTNTCISFFTPVSTPAVLDDPIPGALGYAIIISEADDGHCVCDNGSILVFHGTWAGLLGKDSIRVHVKARRCVKRCANWLILQLHLDVMGWFINPTSWYEGWL